MKKIMTPLLILLLTACSSNNVNNKDAQMEELAKVEKDDKYVCTTIKKTGSHFNTRRCITKEAKKREEENAKKTMEDLDRNWSLHGG
ncbi:MULTISPECIES: hypothetical protein [unclassified Pseudoalteromonas]|uniref:hypothetical protein n=1 Tax=unclassified Pseudoalteromonas TaxID=194690 RepID=UPI000C071FD9|nr:MULTISPECIES: hypothetical protein [unclassified Pseudoalteromonas]MDP2635356.1 hypothetical protein [Pseudoalteromonas sp. 1_MG-2023]PHN89790.1 hypothetical protein CSC79_11035 [Pseudoalteromonas sp. 3D05]TGE77629.1 hypothetical protein C7Y70_17745 [Pseudoalteromonas sp. KS88]